MPIPRYGSSSPSALLAVGILRQSRDLARNGAGGAGCGSPKVFLYDMSDLTGLLRVLSFLGLGLALIGIGRIYRRFVFTG